MDHMCINAFIRKSYLSCSVAKIAKDTYIDAIFKHRFEYSDNPLYDKSNTQYLTEFGWQNFINDCIEQILLFGYIVYYYKSGIPIVCGSHVEIDAVNNNYKANIRNQDHYRHKTHKLHIKIINLPEFHLDGTYKSPRSRMYSAMEFVNRYLAIESNMIKRDDVNTEPSVYASTGTNRYKPTAANARAISQHINDNMMSTYMLSGNNTEDIANTKRKQWEDSIEITEMMRQKHSSDGTPIKPKTPHHEYIITDGMEYREVGHIQSDQTMAAYHGQLGYKIMQLLGVPPQATGQNINTERIAASSHLTNITIEYFTTKVQQFVDILNDIFDSMELDDKIYPPTITIVHSIQTIDKNRHLLKTDALIQMLSHAYNLDPNDFDKTKVDAENTVESNDDAVSFHNPSQSKRRRVQTNEQKDTTYLAKHTSNM
jgi:hypothetical protein